MPPVKIPSAEEEARWFDKLNQPTSGTYRLAHARRQFEEGEPKQFDPQKVRAMVEKTAEPHVKDHVAAVKRMTRRPPGIEPLKTLGGKSAKTAKR